MTYELKEAERSPRQQNLSIYASLKVPTFARFAVVSSVLPNLTEAVSVGERFRQALMKWSRDEFGKADPVFSGRDEAGDYRKDNHQHAWYLPEVNKEGKIDHVLVYAPQGFSSVNAIFALQNLRKVWGTEGFDLQTVLVSLGKVDDYRADARDADRSMRSLIIGKGRKWRSLTPMVLPRHPKRRHTGEPKIDPQTGLWVDGPEDQVHRGLRQLGLDAPIKVDRIDRSSESQYPWSAFQIQRRDGKGSKGLNRGFWFEVVFATSQAGPIALGYAAHFGLGLFIPVER